MNKTIIIGNVCHTPETRSTQSGSTVCSFTVAVNKRRNGEDITTYFRISAWNKLAETCQQYVAKGMKIMVEGEVSARAYMSRDTNEPRASLELVANNVEFLSPRQQNQTPYADPRRAAIDAEQKRAAEQYQREEAAQDGFQDINDSDLPF